MSEASPTRLVSLLDIDCDNVHFLGCCLLRLVLLLWETIFSYVTWLLFDCVSLQALYHEACSSWLDSTQRQEGAEMTKAWRGLAEFFLLGSHLQVTVVEYNINEDSGLDASRRKRQAEETVANEVKKVYIDVMNDMKTKFEADGLTSEQKVAATKVITETQAKLGTFSFNVLGLERGDSELFM